jgi:aminotransferase
MAISARIASIPRSGVREIFDESQKIRDVINLGIGEPYFKTPKFINAAAKNAIERGYDNYTVNAGLPELREAISDKLRRENAIQADPETEVIVTAGATQAIFLVMNCLLNEGDEVVLPTPIFTAYEYSVRLAGGTPIQVPLNFDEGFKFNFEALKKSCSKRTKLFVLNSPCNPTGKVYSQKEIEGLVDFLSQRDMYLLSDEIYEKYLYDNVTHYSPASDGEFREKVITVNGFSKSFGMTGGRLGYACASPEIVSSLTRFNMYDSVCANSIAQRAGISAIRHSGYFFRTFLRYHEECRRIVCQYLDDLSLPYVKPSGSFYVFPKISSFAKDTLKFCKELLTKEHVAVIPGGSFGIAGQGHIRLSYSVEKEKLQQGMRRFGRFIKSPGYH